MNYKNITPYKKCLHKSPQPPFAKGGEDFSFFLSAFFIPFLLVFLLTSANAQQTFNKTKSSKNEFKEIQQLNKEYFKSIPKAKGNGSKPYKRFESFWERRLFNDEEPNIDLLKVKSEMLESNYYPASWRQLGPFYVPKNMMSVPFAGIGRVNCIEFMPGNHKTLFIGTAANGIWKSTNEGLTWDKVFTSQNFSIGISDIKISKADSNIIYAATGDADGISLTRSYSLGILKSTNKGISWQEPENSLHYKDKFMINKLLLDDSNPNIIYAATNNGILYSDNGLETDALIALEYVNVRDIVRKPFSGNIIYAASNNAVYKSNNYGRNWDKKLELDSASRIAISVNSANPALVFAVAVNRYNGGFLGCYLSTDSGEHWELQSNTPNIIGASADGNSIGGQGNYDLILATSIYNQNTIYAGGINIWKSNDYGITWMPLTDWSSAEGYIHEDNHQLRFSSIGKLYSCNDGGVAVSLDTGNTFTDISNGLSILQVYRLGVFKANDDYIITGSQDNGTNTVEGAVWKHYFGGDGMECFFFKDYPSKIVFSLNSGTIYKSENNGESPELLICEADINQKSDWITCTARHPDSLKIFYAGFYDLWRSDQSGKRNTWYKVSNFEDARTINFFAISEINANIIYLAKQNTLFRTINSGISWDSIYSGDAFISYISIDKQNPLCCRISLSGYKDSLKVIEITDISAQNISFNLPNVPVNTIVENPFWNNNIIVGTDVGVFWKNPLLNSWELFGNDMNFQIISELEINEKSKRLFAASFSSGVWRADLPKIYNDSIKLLANTYSICSGDSVEIKTNKNIETFWSNGEIGTSIFAKSSGKYFCNAFDMYGNILLSDTVLITEKPKPEKPSIVNIDNFLYTVFSGDTNSLHFYWYCGEELVSENKDKIEISRTGNYYLKICNDDLCCSNSDTLFAVSDVEIQEKEHISKSVIINDNYFELSHEECGFDIKNIKQYNEAGELLSNDNIKYEDKSIRINYPHRGHYFVFINCGKSMILIRALKI